MGRRWFAGLALAAGLMVGAGCGSEGGAGSPRDDGTLVIAVPEQPDNLNPIYGDNVYAGNLKFFNGLLRYRKDLSPAPDLARALPRVSRDGRTVTVSLRDDVRFSDGRRLTAEDVVFTYRSILDPAAASPLASLLDSLDGVRALDRHTVEFTLTRRDPAFLDKLQIGIVPAAALRGEDLKTAPFNRRPIGTGPYVLAEFEPGGRIVMEANPDHFRGPPAIERVVMTAVEDESARAALLENGTVDAVGILPRLAPRLRAADGVRVLEVPTADTRVIALPTRVPALKDPAVRRALSYAVDREAMVSGVLEGAGEPAHGPIMPGHWAHSPAGEVPYDPEEAGRRLDAAGWRLPAGGDIREKGGTKLGFTLLYPASDGVRRDLALAFTADMARIGVEVTLEGVSFDVIRERQPEAAAVFSWGTPYDPDIELYTLLHPRFAHDDDAFTNYPLSRDQAVADALDAQRSTAGRDARRAAFADLQAAMSEDASWLWLVRQRHVVAVSDRIHGIDPQVEPHAHGFSRGTSWNLERWRLEPRG